MESAGLSEELKHPVILPKKGHVTTLIIRDAHERTAHGGRGITLCELRNRFWIINANSATRFYISRCVACRRLRSKPSEQKMADLPLDRITPEGPFLHCGVDYFGPFLILERRKELKRYGVILTCLASRAVHIETANSLDTDACINALRRFIARRGSVRVLRSDNGTNLVGSERELKQALKELCHEKISETLKREYDADWITWRRNPPTASHMGGVWERQIRTIRAILAGLLRDQGHALDDESFRTFMTEVESIINSHVFLKVVKTRVIALGHATADVTLYVSVLSYRGLVCLRGPDSGVRSARAAAGRGVRLFLRVLNFFVNEEEYRR